MVRNLGLGRAALACACAVLLVACGSGDDTGGNAARDGGSGGGSSGGSGASSTGSSGGTSSTSGSASGSSGSSGGASTGGSGGSGGAGGAADASASTPSIAITSPTSGSAVANVVGSVPVSFTTTNFTLVSAGDPACVDASDNCGHVHLFVDATACTPPGAPYNNDGQASPIDARLTSCPAVAGLHTVELELHHNDHSPVVVGGSVVSTSVMFTAM
jgi:hypothetical protein